MSRRLLLVAVVLGCGHEPSFEDKMREYEAAIATAIADAKPTYQRLAKLRTDSAATTPACTGPAPRDYARMSSARLKMLGGEPVDADGWLVAKTDPMPDFEHGWWDTVFGLQSPSWHHKGLGQIEDMKHEMAKGVAAVAAAPGFLVQVIDAYQAPEQTSGRSDGGNFIPGTIRGRLVELDKSGTPRCHYAYEAKSSYSIPPATTTVDNALAEDLARNMGKAILAATQLPEPAR